MLYRLVQMRDALCNVYNGCLHQQQHEVCHSWTGQTHSSFCLGESPRNNRFQHSLLTQRHSQRQHPFHASREPGSPHRDVGHSTHNSSVESCKCGG